MRIKKFFSYPDLRTVAVILALAAAVFTAPAGGVCGGDAQVNIDRFKSRHLFLHYGRVKEFDRTSIIKVDETAFQEKREEIVIRNARGQALRFVIEPDHRLGSYHGGIAFCLFEYDDEGFLKKVSYFDKKGKLYGEPEYDDNAIFEFVIVDYKNLKSKMKIIDERDGNIDIPEKKRPVIRRLLNSSGELLDESGIPTTDYWMWNHMLFRP